MGEVANLIVFYTLALGITVSSVLAVTSRRMLRAATYLLFVLIGTAGLYLMLNYHFLAAVQLSVYAGGILILFIFAITLTNTRGDTAQRHGLKRIAAGAAAAVAGAALVLFALVKHGFLYSGNPTIKGDQEIDMEAIGTALLGTDRYQYLLSFEALSILLLACAIGGIIIARKR